MKKILVTVWPLVAGLLGAYAVTHHKMDSEVSARLLALFTGGAMGHLVMCMINGWNSRDKDFDLIQPLAMKSGFTLLGFYLFCSIVILGPISTMSGAEMACMEMLGGIISFGIFLCVDFAKKEWAKDRPTAVVAGVTGLTVTTIMGWIGVSLIATQFPNWIQFMP
jgi:hypothetical protein